MRYQITSNLEPYYVHHVFDGQDDYSEIRAKNKDAALRAFYSWGIADVTNVKVLTRQAHLKKLGIYSP